jgi:hypothetical protein
LVADLIQDSNRRRSNGNSSSSHSGDNQFVYSTHLNLPNNSNLLRSSSSSPTAPFNSFPNQFVNLDNQQPSIPFVPNSKRPPHPMLINNGIGSHQLNNQATNRTNNPISSNQNSNQTNRSNSNN